MTMTIGKNIRKLRLERQITQEELAKRMKVSCAAVSKWERGDAFPDITFLMPLAYFFHVSIDELMGYHDAVFEEEISEKMAVIKNRMEENKTEEARTLLLELIHQYHSDLRIFIFYILRKISRYLSVFICKLMIPFLFKLCFGEHEDRIGFIGHGTRMRSIIVFAKKGFQIFVGDRCLLIEQGSVNRARCFGHSMFSFVMYFQSYYITRTYVCASEFAIILQRFSVNFRYFIFMQEVSPNVS